MCLCVLDNNFLENTIVTEIGKLSSLNELVLGKLKLHMIVGKVIVTISSTTGLCFFCKDDNRLTGAIPSELGKLIRLKYLTFGMCTLTFLIQSLSLIHITSNLLPRINCGCIR